MLVFRNTDAVRTLVFEFELILCYHVVRKAYHVFLFILQGYIYILVELIRRQLYKAFYCLYGIRASLIIIFPIIFLIMTDPNNTSLPNLVTINVTAQAPLKLTSSNYWSWKLQFQTLFIGYDLQGFVDGTKPYPP